MEATQMVPAERYDLAQRRPARRSGGGILLATTGLTLFGVAAAAFAARASGKKQATRRRPEPPLTPEPPAKPTDTRTSATPPSAPPPPATPIREFSEPLPTRRNPTPQTPPTFVFSPQIWLNEMLDRGELSQEPTLGNTGIVGPNFRFRPEPARPGPLSGDADPGDALVLDLTPQQYSDAWLKAYREGYAYGKTLKPSQASTKIVSLAHFAGMRAGALGQASNPPAAGPDRRDYLQGYDLGKATDRAQFIEIMRGEASALGSLDAVRGLAQRAAPAVLA